MHDFIAIGDTATDVFIRLGDDSRALVTGTPDTPDYRLSLPFAEKLPYEEATVCAGVGNAPNAAAAAALLGLKSALIARVGDDAAGQETLESLKKFSIDTSLVLPQSGKQTNYSYILWYKQERTILRKHEDFSYNVPDLGLPAPGATPFWIYLSAVGTGTQKFYEDFSKFIGGRPDVKFAFQPAGGEVGLGTKLAQFYKRADIFFCNVEEAGIILGIPTLGTIELLKRMHELGPKIVVITDGPKGAYAYDPSTAQRTGGTGMYFVPVFPDGLNAFERTGAGDAFASTTTAALALGQDLPTALAWGAVNSASVVQKIGAQEGLLSKEDILKKLAANPDFKTKPLS